MNKINIIFFDVGDVLLFRKSHPLEYIAEVLDIDFDSAVRANETVLNSPEFKIRDKKVKNLENQYEFHGWVGKEFLKQIGLPNNQKNMKVFNYAWLKHGYELMPGTIEILEYLKPKYRLSIISNARPSRRHYELVDFKLLDYFDPILLSQELGIHKPDTEIFKSAFKLAKVKPQEAAFIDDKPYYLEGAYKAGINCLFQMTARRELNIYKHATEIKDLIDLKKYL